MPTDGQPSVTAPLPARAGWTAGARFESGLRGALLALTLAVPCVLGFMTSYALALLAAVALIYLLFTRRPADFRLDIAGAGFLAAFAVLLVLFALSSQQPGDVRFVFNFAAFLFFVPVASILWRGHSAAASLVVANLALLGTGVGAALALGEKLLLNVQRSGRLTSDPIRLADTALILGFLALIGVFAAPPRRRWLYLLGPLLALLAIFLTGSRGAIFAAPAMLVVAVFTFLRSKVSALLISVALMVVLVALLGLADRLAGARSSTLLIILQSFASGDTVADRNLGIRVELYRAAFTAFFDAPLIGHGWARLMSAPGRIPAARLQEERQAAAPAQRHAQFRRRRRHRRHRRLSGPAGVADRRRGAQRARQPVSGARLWRDPACRQLPVPGHTGHHGQLRAAHRPLRRHHCRAAQLLPRRPGRGRGAGSMTTFGRRFDAGLAAVALGGTLLLMYPIGNLAAYLLMLVSVVATLRLLGSGGPLMVPADPAALMLTVAVALLALAFAFEDVAFTVNFIMLVLYAPLSALLARLGAPGNAERVGWVALAGATLATAMALFQVFVLHDKRAPSLFSDPIWSAQAAVVLGFVAAIGFVAVADRRRYLFLAGPVLGTITTLLSGSRGPLLAIPPMLAAVLLVGARRRWRALLISLGLILVIGMVGTIALYFFWPYGFSRVQSLPRLALDIFTGDRIAERSGRQRVAFYTSSWGAFMAQPWVGYGWGEKMHAIVPYLADNGRMLREGHHHLHSDILDFGVSAGVLGLISYALVLAAPIAGVLGGARDSQYRARLLGAVLLVIGYALCGLTYLTLGYEYGTSIYAAVAAILIGYCRDDPVTRSARTPTPVSA